MNSWSTTAVTTSATNGAQTAALLQRSRNHASHLLTLIIAPAGTASAAGSTSPSSSAFNARASTAPLLPRPSRHPPPASPAVALLHPPPNPHEAARRHRPPERPSSARRLHRAQLDGGRRSRRRLYRQRYQASGPCCIMPARLVHQAPPSVRYAVRASGPPAVPAGRVKPARRMYRGPARRARRARRASPAAGAGGSSGPLRARARGPMSVSSCRALGCP